MKFRFNFVIAEGDASLNLCACKGHSVCNNGLGSFESGALS